MVTPLRGQGATAFGGAEREKQLEGIKTETAPVVDVVALCPCPNVPHQPFSWKLVKAVVCRAVGDSGYIIFFLQEEDFQKTQKS